MEKIKKRKEVHHTEMCDELSIDELRAILKDAEKNYGAEYIEIETDDHYDRCGDYESSTTYMNFIKYELESDEEFEARKERIRKEEEKKKREAEEKKRREEEAKRKQEEKEKEQLQELMQKYPGIVKNRRK